LCQLFWELGIWIEWKGIGKENTQLEVSEKSNSQGNREGRLEGEEEGQGEMEAVSSFLLGLP